MPFPNPSTQFLPGQSGNPKGLAKGTKHKSTWIQELTNDPEFEALLTTSKGPVEFKGAPFEAIVRTAIHKSLYDKDKGAVWAEWIAKHGWVETKEPMGNTYNIGVSIYNGLSARPEAVDVQGYQRNSESIPAQPED